MLIAFEINKIMLHMPDNLVIALRLASLSCLAYYALSINWYSLSFFVLSFVSLYLISKKSTLKKTSTNFKVNEIKRLENPYKSVKRLDYSQIESDIIEKTKNDLIDYYLIDYSYAESLKLFEEIKRKSECIFAKRSKLWGSAKWNDSLDIKDNVTLIILPPFIVFSNFCTNLKLDGFLIHLSGKHGKDVETFAQSFCEILKTLALNNPTGNNCMKSKESVDKSSWVFEFNKQTFFITTFAPCYPSSNSRFTYDLNECFLLFQPEVSFAIHDLPPDTPLTNWSHPQTVRDKIRVAFRNAGQSYLIRDTINYPMSHDIIKPLHMNDDIIKWWNHI